MNIKHLQDTYHGMVCDHEKQFWSFGQGYYRKNKGTVVYLRGKKILDLGRPGTKEKLKELLINTEAQFNLFGG